MSNDLERRISDAHTKVLVLGEILKALDACLDDPDHKGLAVHLVEGAMGIADKTVEVLDPPSQPKEDVA